MHYFYLYHIVGKDVNIEQSSQDVNFLLCCRLLPETGE